MGKRAKPRLGRGLSSLIGDPVRVEATTAQTKTEYSSAPPEPEPAARPAAAGGAEGAEAPAGMAVRSLALGEIAPGRFQPRQGIDEEGLAGLAESIRAEGVMQPILVRPAGTDAPQGVRYELIAGERRWRAARLAGLERVPAIETALDDRDAATWALVENVQREDLDPIERAEALRALVERFGLTQAALAERIGVGRPTVANLMRLTELEGEIRDLIRSGALSAGHAKALLGAPPGEARGALAARAASEGWSVRALEEAVRDGAPASDAGAPAPKDGSRRAPAPDPTLADLERQLGESLGTKVRVRTDASRKKGRIVLEFYSIDHFEGLLGALGIRLDP